MLSTLRKYRRRFSGVTWDEFRTRTLQAAGQQCDFARYVLRLPLKAHRLNFSRPRFGRFFFSPEDLPEIAVAVRDRLNDQAQDVIRSAEGICQHRFRLLGYTDVLYGKEIDWHLDAVHEKRAPAKPWFTVPFLSFSEVGDHKIIWELNRHQHLVTLAKAWVLTGDRKYAAEALRQWYSWRSANPYPIGINWASSLEVAFRSLSWLWVRFLLAGYRAPEGFEQDLAQALALNATHIERNLSTYFSPNTHLLGEAVALFFIGTLYPQLRSASRWQARGMQIVIEEAGRQVRPDGFYFEQSLYYHVYALDLFVHFRLLASRNHLQIPDSFDTILNRMLNALRALTPAGPPEGFGDDDGGRMFDSARHRSEHLIDPLATGALLMEREDLRRDSTLTEEAVWLFGTAALKLASISCPVEPKSQGFPDAGIYVMASSDACSERLVMDAGDMGPGRGGHGHADALSVTVSTQGRRCLVDSGTLCYSGPDKQRDRFRGTAAHNTLVVDGLDQAIPDGPFAWQALPNVQVERWVPGGTFSFLVAHHNGYLRLADPVVHRRFVFHLHGSFFLVRDFVECANIHDLQVSWHVAQGFSIKPERNSYILSVQESLNDLPQIAMCFPESSGWKYRLESSEVSPAYGVMVPAHVLRIKTRAKQPTEFASLIVPLVNHLEKPGILKRIDCEDSSGAQGYRYEAQGVNHSMFFGGKQESWNLEDWQSDASFLHLVCINGETTELRFCDASFVTYRRNPVFQHLYKAKRLEWKKSTRVLSSDEGVTLSFRPSYLEMCQQPV